MNSIRRRLTVHLLLVIVVLALLGNVVLYFRVRMALKREHDEGLLDRAGALSHLIAWDENGHMMLEIPERSLDEFNRASGPDYLEVWRPDHSVFFRSHGLHGQDISSLPAQGNPQSWYLTLPDGRPGRATAWHFVPHLEADESHDTTTKAAGISPPPGEATLVLASDLDRVNSFLDHLIEGQLVISILLAMFSAIAVLFSVRRSVKPLERLGREADALPVGILDRRFSQDDLPVELTPIVRRLNDLLSRIESAFKRERRFTANVAHELRTPIAELRTMAEVALASPHANALERQDFEEALGIARQMQSLVESLLAIARAEASDRARLRPTDLTLLIQGVIKPHLGAAAERGQRFDCVIDPGEAMTDSSLLEPLLSNLISNAVAHAPPASTITIRCRVIGTGLHIVISNDAPDLTAEDIPHLTEPFWRKDTVRTKGQHVGLGLPVAVAYADMLKLVLVPVLEKGCLQLTLSTDPHWPSVIPTPSA